MKNDISLSLLTSAISYPLCSIPINKTHINTHTRAHNHHGCLWTVKLHYLYIYIIYHTHLIRLNEIWNDLLFIMHHCTADARYRSTTHTHTTCKNMHPNKHTSPQHCRQHQSHNVSRREGSSLFSWS